MILVIKHVSDRTRYDENGKIFVTTVYSMKASGI